MTHPSLLGVLYAEDFDVDEAAPATPPPAPEPAEPGFTAADVEDARQQGIAAGRQQAEHGLAASRLHMLGLVASALAEAKGDAARLAGEAAEGVARCLLSSLAACLPALCTAHGPAELRALVRHVLPGLVQEPRITIRANPHMLPMLREEVEQLDNEVADAVVLVATDALPPGDARIAWRDGAAIRDAAAARRTVEDALAALGLLQPEDAHA